MPNPWEMNWGEPAPAASARPWELDWGPTPPEPSGRGLLGSVADIGITALKGAIGVPESIVGIADLLTAGQAGKLAEEAGFRPKEAKAILDRFYTPAQQAANEAVKVPGFLETLKAAIQNPSTILHAAVESAPSMLGGGVVARGLLKAAPTLSPLAAGAIGEGVVAAGQNTEQLRQETPTGTLTPEQSALMAGSGALTGLIGFAGGQLAKKFGIADIDTWIAGGATTKGLAQQPGLLKRVTGGALSEGVFEELPQSAQEQIAQNIALGKPWDENAGNAAAMGMLVGGVMGGGANVLAPNAEGEPFPVLPDTGLPSTIPEVAPGPGSAPTTPAEVIQSVMSADSVEEAGQRAAQVLDEPLDMPEFETRLAGLGENAAIGLIGSTRASLAKQDEFARAQEEIQSRKTEDYDYAQREVQTRVDTLRRGIEAEREREQAQLEEDRQARTTAETARLAQEDIERRAQEVAQRIQEHDAKGLTTQTAQAYRAALVRRLEAMGFEDPAATPQGENVQPSATIEAKSKLGSNIVGVTPDNAQNIDAQRQLAHQKEPIAPETGTIAPNISLPETGSQSPNLGMITPELGITTPDVEAIQSIPTVEKMRAAMALVGEDEFQRQAQEKIEKYKPTTPNQEAMLVEATAIEILASQRRSDAVQVSGEPIEPPTPQEAPGRAQPAAPAGGIAEAPPAQGAQASQATSRIAEINAELAKLQAQYETKSAGGGRNGMVPPSIKASALKSITDKMDRLDAEKAELLGRSAQEPAVSPAQEPDVQQPAPFTEREQPGKLNATEKELIDAEKTAPVAEKAPAVRINGQLPAEMTVAQLQFFAQKKPDGKPKNVFYADQANAAAAELKNRDKKGETVFGKTADQLTDSELAVVAGRGKNAMLRAAAKAEQAKRTADAAQLTERLKAPGIPETLQSLAEQAGWAEKGGHLIRTKTGEAAGQEKISRTKWIPRAEWWPGRPVQEPEDYYRAAVAKALAGGKLTSKQTQVVKFMLDLAEYEGQDAPPDITQTEAVSAQEEVDIRGQEPDSWSIMNEDEKENELDAIFGQDTRQAAEGAQARAPVAQGEVGQAGAAQAQEVAPEPLLASYTNAEIAQREAAAKAAEEAKAKEEAAAKRGPNVRADQVDLFNTQGGIFDSPANQLSPADLLRAAAAKMDQESASNRSEATIAESKAGRVGIKDFGEKISGARKDYAAKLAEAKDSDIASVPLSKSWPEPDYQKLLEGGSDPWAVGFMHAARDEIPTKPQQSWKLQRWVAQVELLRNVTMGLADGTMNVARAKQLMDEGKSFQSVRDRTELYIEVGHEKSLKGIRVKKGSYSLYNKIEYNPPKIIWSVEMPAARTAYSHWPKMLATGDTHSEAIANFKKAWLATTPEQDASKAIDFQIYSKTGKVGEKSEIFIGKKIGAHVAELKGGFVSAKEARTWKDANQSELVKLLEKYKNVPYERKESNSPRVGVDHRNGADVTPERFAEAFGFRGVQFGNYVEDAKRQQDLNEAYDALMDLAGVLGVPSKALSLNGELGLAFGARGTGGIRAPSAHYEPVQIVINLTKARGAGSLAHEWFHGVDNYFSRMGGKASQYLTEARETQTGVRLEMVEAFRQVMRAVRNEGLTKRSLRLDRTRSKPYWATGLEMAARSFETYIVAKLQDQNASNDYLANIVSEDYWKAATALGMEKEDTYPYPTAGEMTGIRAAFDNFFQTVETRETDKGVALYSRTDKGATPLSTGIITPEVQALNDKMAKDFKDEKWRNAYALAQPGAARSSIAAAIKAAFGKDTVFVAHTISEGSGFEGMSYGGRIYVNVANERHGFVNILGHELLHELKRDRPDLYRFFASKAEAYRVPGGTERYARALESVGGTGFDVQEETLGDFTGDALADPNFLRALAEQNPSKFKQLLNEVISWLKRVATKLYGKGFRSSEYFTDVNALKDYLAAVLSVYAEQNNPDTIGGVETPRFSRAQDQTQTEAFKKWFGDSKVVDADGKPLVVYHGTTGKFNEFDFALTGTSSGGTGTSAGFFFAADRDHAEYWAKQAKDTVGGRPRIISAFLKIKNPLVVDFQKEQIAAMWGTELFSLDTIAKRIQDGKHDGAIIYNVKGDTGDTNASTLRTIYVVSDAETQIKSIGNTGAFDPNNPDIRFSRTPPIANSQTTGGLDDTIAARSSSFIRDMLHSDRRFGWWERSIGTPQHKALTNEQYKPVYDEGQFFLADVYKYANMAADMALDLLPRIEGFRDFFKKSPPPADVQAAMQATMAGTLYGGGNPLEGRLWTDEELKAGRAGGNAPSVPLFKPLTDAQVKLYREAMNSVGVSLENFAKSLIHRLVVRHGIGMDREMVLKDMTKVVVRQINVKIADLQEKLEEISDPGYIENMAKDAANYAGGDREGERAAARARGGLAKEADTLTEQIRVFEGLKTSVEDVEQKATALKEHGYFPAQRFGQFAIHLTTKPNAQGERKQLYFGLFESQTKANLAYRELIKQYPEADLSPEARPRGMINPDKYKLFQGLSLDALENFADYVEGADGQPISKDPLVQGFLKAAVSERSALKHHIHRKGIAGYSEDMPRVLASFTVSMARAISSNYHGAEMDRLAMAITDGDVQKDAVGLVRYLKDPLEEAHRVRGFLFAQFLGGSLAHGIVNMTQPWMVTAPFLSQYTSFSNAVKQLSAATVPGKLTGKIAEAFERAKVEGIRAPQEIHQLRAETGGMPLAKNLALRKLMFAWGSIYSITEQFNRSTTFLAAYRIAEDLIAKDRAAAKKRGIVDPYEFAKEAVQETQFVYNKGNRPNWFRGPIGATVGTFKQFSISYLELAKRLYNLRDENGKRNPKPFALMMMMLLAASGMEGLPFSDDMEDLIDTIGQWMGFATNSKKRVRQLVSDTLGPELGQIALKGLSGFSWMPVDVSLRMGMQNLIPGSAALKLSEKNKARDVLEMVGPIGQFAPVEGTMLGRALERLSKGDMFGVAKSAAPLAVQNVLKGGEMFRSGVYKDTEGKKIVDTTGGEAAFKMFGLQPASVARESQRIQDINQDTGLQRRTEDEIAEQWARGRADNDPAEVRDAMAKLVAWNRNNPELRIRITTQQIRQRVNKMRIPRAQRTIKSAPPELRAGVREALR